MSQLLLADVQGVLLNRCGVAMATVGMDSTTSSSPNADLQDPIRYAVRAFGVQLAGAVSVTDSDLATIQGFTVEKLLDLAEKRVLETCINRYVYVDSQVDRDSQKYDQLRRGWQARVDALTVQLKQPYGPGSGNTSGGQLAGGRPVRNEPYTKIWRGWPLP